MLLRAKFYRDRVLHLVSIIGAVASVLGAGFPVPLVDGSVVLWRLGVLLIAVPCIAFAIVLVFRSEHPTRVYRVGADTDIANYLHHWIQTGGHVVICTRDMSWASEPRMMNLLASKAESRELTIVLPEDIATTDYLRARGAEVLPHGNLELVSTRFTIVNYRQQGARVAIGWRSGDRHVIQEFSATDDHPAFYLAQNIVKLAQDQNHERRSHVDGSTI